MTIMIAHSNDPEKKRICMTIHYLKTDHMNKVSHVIAVWMAWCYSYDID